MNVQVLPFSTKPKPLNDQEWIQHMIRSRPDWAEKDQAERVRGSIKFSDLQVAIEGSNEWKKELESLPMDNHQRRKLLEDRIRGVEEWIESPLVQKSLKKLLGRLRRKKKWKQRHKERIRSAKQAAENAATEADKVPMIERPLSEVMPDNPLQSKESQRLFAQKSHLLNRLRVLLQLRSKKSADEEGNSFYESIRAQEESQLIEPITRPTPKISLSEYYNQHKKSTAHLVAIRREWDQYIVAPGTPGSSRVPPEEIQPDEPCSSAWESMLMKRSKK